MIILDVIFFQLIQPIPAIIREIIDQLSSGRIDAQHARQAIMQKVREIQRNKRIFVRIVLIGRTKFLLNTGELFLKNGIDVGLIITSKNAEHDVVTKNDFGKLAKRFNAEFVYDANINSEKIKKILLQKKFDLGISVNNPLLIKKEIIDLFKFGILNAHPGDLPRYRGNACPNWAIINNEKMCKNSSNLL